MNERKKNVFITILTGLTTLSIFLSSCANTPTVTPTPMSKTQVVPAPSSTRTVTPGATATPTETPVPFPSITLKPGEYYFNVDGKQGFVFSRNLAGYQVAQYGTLLDWSKAGGTRFVRIQLDSFGMGYTSSGSVDPNWLAQWDQVFDKAETDGIYVLLTFTAWYDWNAGNGYSTWKNNPLNQASGGPAKTPGELFQKNSPTQTTWLNWLDTLVKHWQGRRNILGWEVFSEVNLATGSTETDGIDFVNTAAALIRTSDTAKRPVTASIADTGTWPNFYKQADIDFINLHPYPPSAQLDRAIISQVRTSLGQYRRPLLIGESGLSADTPDSTAGKLTVATNAPIGIRHAIWAGIVSGAMNGRSLWWEDGVGIYFQNLGIPWMQKYEKEELPAVNFVEGVDFTGFAPLQTTYSSGVWGAAIGDEKYVIGWYRDATCEPPTWDVKAVVSKQTVTITLPGTVSGWQVDFYDTQTGTKLISSSTVSRKGSTVTLTLPDFTDAIAFKMRAKN